MVLEICEDLSWTYTSINSQVAIKIEIKPSVERKLKFRCLLVSSLVTSGYVSREIYFELPPLPHAAHIRDIVDGVPQAYLGRFDGLGRCSLLWIGIIRRILLFCLCIIMNLLVRSHTALDSLDRKLDTE